MTSGERRRISSSNGNFSRKEEVCQYGCDLSPWEEEGETRYNGRAKIMRERCDEEEGKGEVDQECC